VKDLNGSSDMVESNACLCLHLGGQLCALLCYQNISHKPMVQLEVLINRNDYFTSNKQTLNNSNELNIVQSTMCLDN
jgi:hypothetical protein